jgi:hypothetical protein
MTDALTYFRQNLKPGDEVVRVVDSKGAFGSSVLPLTFVCHEVWITDNPPIRGPYTTTHTYTATPERLNETSRFQPNTVLVEFSAPPTHPARVGQLRPDFLFPVEYGILMERLFNERKAAILAPWYQKMNAFFEAGAPAVLATREPKGPRWTWDEERYPTSHIYTPGQELVWEPTNITPLVEGTP